MQRFLIIFLSVVLVSECGYSETKTEPVSNDQAVQQWSDNNPASNVPVVTVNEDGSTTLTWTVNVNYDRYQNSVTTKNGSVNTSMQNGQFHKTAVNTNVHQLSKGSDSYFALNLVETDDMTSATKNTVQINQLQLGRKYENFNVILGDINPSFSSLSTSLGAKGLFLSGQAESSLVGTGFYGTVSESWEALNGKVLRNQFLKDVYGAKLEKKINENLGIYVTSQTGVDRVGSVTNPAMSGFAKSTYIQAYSAGINYAKDNLQLNYETATGQGEIISDQSHSGPANLLDLKWNQDNLSLFSGFHDINSRFNSLSGSASPGLEEKLLGFDWAVKSWMNLGFDLRKTRNFTMQSTKPLSENVSKTYRGSTNFDQTNWNMNLQYIESVTDVVAASENIIKQSNLNLSYNQDQTWSVAVGLGNGDFRYSDLASNNTTTIDSSISFFKSFKSEEKNSEGVGNWTIDSGISLTGQEQSYSTNQKMLNTQYAINLSGQKNVWGKLSMDIIIGKIKQPIANSTELVTNSQKLEYSKLFSDELNLKVYLKNVIRNANDPILESTESVYGVNLTKNF